MSPHLALINRGITPERKKVVKSVIKLVLPFMTIDLVYKFQRVRVMVFNATFNKISGIPWWVNFLLN